MMAYLQTSPKMEAFYEDYVAYLREEKHCSPNTLSAYQRDMQKFFDYAEEFGIASFDGVEASDVSSYKQYLLRRGLSASSVSRSLSALRGLYQYLISVGAAEHNPAREGAAGAHEQGNRAAARAAVAERPQGHPR